MILVFPGQGSQKPGMAKDLVERFPQAREVFERADEALGFSLSTLCFEGPSEELMLTHNAQPALLAHSAAVWAVLKDKLRTDVRGASGHSLGELSAYHAMGALSLEAALRLVRTRGELMYAAGQKVPGAMAAILGSPSRTIEEICTEASAHGVVVPANYNNLEQIVISGEVAAVEAAMEIAKEAGAKKTMRLQVSGAFHSPLMSSAAEGFATALDAAHWRDPSVPVWSNVTAEAVGDADTAKRLLLQQLTSPVRWVEVVRNIAARFPGTTFVEAGPGQVLSGLIRRLAPDCSTMTCGTVAEVEALLQ
jgi:[acyl-carrier-protein] S-malonyltransferase